MTIAMRLTSSVASCCITEQDIALTYRECPEECREVVASLMYAAARFSDFPELRDLRDVFQQKYGSLEAFVNQKVMP